MITQFDAGLITSGSVVNGTSGDDTIHGTSGSDTIYGLDGNDRIIDKGGDNLIFGGAGDDTIDASMSGSNVIDGGDGNDSIDGGFGGDSLTGGAGNDTIMGGGGNDTIEGGAGDDALFGDNPFLIVVQHDTLSYQHAEGGITLHLDGLDPQDTGGAGIDTVFGFQDLIGSSFGDHLYGGDLDNIIHAGFGDDIVVGQGGADAIYGEVGADNIHGGSGNDTIDGGEGQDKLSGGKGADVFVFDLAYDTQASAPDLIRDLGAGDTIDLSQIDASLPDPGQQHFTLVSALDGHAGEVALVYDAGKDVTHVEMDLDGDGKADSTIDISGDHHDFTGLVL